MRYDRYRARRLGPCIHTRVGFVSRDQRMAFRALRRAQASGAFAHDGLYTRSLCAQKVPRPKCGKHGEAMFGTPGRFQHQVAIDQLDFLGLGQ